jgi:ABC-type branched-subunit amino acid transport system ATPase component
VSFDGFRVIDGLSITLGLGEMRAVIGPNGAGKTSIMDIITGKTRPDAGDVIFDQTVDLTEHNEATIAQMAVARKFQRPTVFETHTVFDNLLLSLAGPRGVMRTLHARPTADERERIETLRETVPDGGQMAIVLVEQFFDFAWELAGRIVVLERGAVDPFRTAFRSRSGRGGATGLRLIDRSLPSRERRESLACP